MAAETDLVHYCQIKEKVNTPSLPGLIQVIFLHTTQNNVHTF